ncbi:MAG: PQQ-binding-like beta-propeller repeat protein [Opitutaceae bacterium]|nr:PQQ-binding-like beta-propeller repeat protein [Opitutaceae bacterium]
MSDANATSALAIDRDNPWPGLATFTEEQAGLFHGRDAEIRDLTKRAERNPLTVLFGQSGLGKSSLLQAGVFPRLRASSYWPIYVRLDHGPGAPTPTEQIKALVLADTARAGTWTKPGSAQPGESLWEFFHHRDDKLIGANGRTIVPVLVFDQFEELFTLGAGAGSERARAVAFMSELAELVENRPSEKLVARLEESSAEMEVFDFSRTDYRVVITLREDYLPHLEGLKTIMPALMENRMRLARMTGTQALDAVVKPGGALVTEDVARAIVEFVAGAKGGSIERLAELDVEPPLLSVICRELNERRRALGQAQITADLVSGNRREILTDFYERSVADLPAGLRTFIEDKLLTKSGFRDNLALETALEEPGVTRPLIDTLVARRLLRIEDRIGTQRVELTHDVLADVVRASRDARQQRLVVEQARVREERAHAEAARRTRRLRFAIAGLAVAVVGLSIGAVFGIRAQRRATEHASRGDLLLGSRLLDEGRLSEGLAYLVSAARKDPGNSVLAPRILTTLAGHNFTLPVGTPLALPSPGANAVYLADGRRILVQSEDATVRIIDADTWRVERVLAFEQGVRRDGVQRADRNSNVFAVMLADGGMLVCDASTGRPLREAFRPPEAMPDRWVNFRLSPDGRWLALGGREKLWLWDVSSGELRATLPNNGSYYRVFAFSPDSRRIATTHGARAERVAPTTQIWSVPDGTPVGQPMQQPGSQWVDNVQFSADGNRLLIHFSVGAEDYAGIYHAATGEPIRSQYAMGTAVWQVGFSRDGSRLIYAVDRAVHVVDVNTGKPVFPPLIHGGPIRESRVSEDGTILFTNSVDGLFRLWDFETGKLRAEPTFAQANYAPAVLAPDGRTVALFAPDALAYRMRLGAGAAVPLVLPRFAGAPLIVNWMARPPARLLWFTRAEARAVDVVSGRNVEGGFTYPTPLVSLTRSSYGGTAGVGDTFLTPRLSDGIHAWHLSERGIAHDVVLIDAPAVVGGGGLRLSRTGKRLAHIVQEGDARSIGILDTLTGRRVATIKPSAPLTGLPGDPFSGDDRLVVIRTTDDALQVCDVASGQTRFEVQLSGQAKFNTERFSANGAHLLTGDTWGGVQVWDAGNGTLLHTTQAHRTVVTRFDFSDDGRYYASLSADGSVQVWDAGTHARFGPPLVQDGAPARVYFSPDSRRIITPSLGGTARVWDVQSGLPLTAPLTHDGDQVLIVSFSPDGRFVSTSQFGTTPKGSQRVWPAPPDSQGTRTPKWLLQLAAICAGQRLNDDGKLVSAADEFARIDEVRAALAALPADDPYAEWGRWILSENPTRPIAPRFTITPAEAKKLREEYARVGSAAP